MISNKLRKLFLVSLGLIYLHVVEELLTGFQHVDSFMLLGGNIIGTTPENFYWILHAIWLLGVPAIYYLFRRSERLLLLASLFGVIFLVEFHHLVKGIIRMSYYPGMVTALLYPIIGIYYWKQLLFDWNNKKK